MVLTGFEELMYQSNTERSALLQQFNIQRDSLVRDFPCWWILLIHPASRQAWRTVAPDFSDFVALWIEADIEPTNRDANSRLSLESHKSQIDFGDSVGTVGWPKQLKSAQAAILANQFDSALDQIISFEVQVDPKRTERETAIANLLKDCRERLRQLHRKNESSMPIIRRHRRSRIRPSMAGLRCWG